MARRWKDTWRPVAGGLIVAGLLGAILQASGLSERIRENATDRLIAGTATASGMVTVVDIDSASLEAISPWPWPRATLAELVRRIAGAGPKAIGIDILLAGPDRFAPQNLAALLPETEAALKGRLLALPDTDAGLAEAIGLRPTVLSSLFSAAAGDDLPQVPVLLNGTPPRLSPWAAPGAVAPLPELAARAAGIGVSSLAGDQSGVVRSVPLMGTAGKAIAAGFAAELLRQSVGASAYILDGSRNTLSIGDHSMPLDRTVSLRFRPGDRPAWAARTTSARTVMTEAPPLAGLAGRIVIIGSSAPELGALRITATSPVTPSAQIEADALETMLSGAVPFRPGWAGMAETGGFVALALAGALAGGLLGPALAMGVTLGLAVAWGVSASTLLTMHMLVLDPVTPALGLLFAGVTASVLAAVRQRRHAAAIRRRFEQHLSPAVVARMAENPDIIRLEGERREITALFTDIEGFSSLADRIGPQALIALLDEYFTGVVDAIVRHGGMVDKFVGDAVHGFFNAPLDLPDHPRRAYEAAEAILAFTESYRKTPRAVEAGFGRTRIGLECGEVVIGDVGAGDKVDYTAHGMTVNMAARLEAMNKVFGTEICIGPRLAARIAGISLRSLGKHEIRGCGVKEIFTPERQAHSTEA